MELSRQDGNLINNYIQGNGGSPKRVLYWPWATQEVMELLDWMRDYNYLAQQLAQSLRWHDLCRSEHPGWTDPLKGKYRGQYHASVVLANK